MSNYCKLSPTVSYAQQVMDSHNNLSVKFMARWMGVPYLFRGDSAKGVDCLQLIVKFLEMKRVETKLPEVYSFAPFERITQVRAEMRTGKWTISTYDGRKVHDIVIINERHLGAMLTKDVYIHALIPKRAVVLSSVREEKYNEAKQKFLFARAN